MVSLHLVLVYYLYFSPRFDNKIPRQHNYLHHVQVECHLLLLCYPSLPGKDTPEESCYPRDTTVSLPSGPPLPPSLSLSHHNHLPFTIFRHCLPCSPSHYLNTVLKCFDSMKRFSLWGVIFHEQWKTSNLWVDKHLLEVNNHPITALSFLSHCLPCHQSNIIDVKMLCTNHVKGLLREATNNTHSAAAHLVSHQRLHNQNHTGSRT